MRRGAAGLRGVTLVEVTTAAAVLVLLLALMVQFVGAATRGWGRERERAEAMRLWRNAMGLMASDLGSVCRSPVLTNLVIECGGEARGPWLGALVTRPGERGDVCAVAYWLRADGGRGTSDLVRSFLPAGPTSEILRAGGDPLCRDAAIIDEVLASAVRDLRFATIPRATGSTQAFTTNFPDLIEVSFSLGDATRGEGFPFRCQLPLR